MMFNRKHVVLTISLIAGAAHADTHVSSKDLHASTKHTSNLKICYVDSVSAMRDSKAGQIVTAELEAKRAQMAGELQRIEKSFTQDVKAFQEKASTMSEDAREKTGKELAKRERDLKMKAQEYEEEFKVAMQKATEKLSKDVDDAVYQYAREQKFDVVVDKFTGRVIYSAADQEPTMVVVSIMDKNHEQRLAVEGKKPATTTVAKADKKPAVTA